MIDIPDNQTIVLTGAQLTAFAIGIVNQTIDALRKTPEIVVTEDTTRFRYGLRAIMEEFNVSHTTAQEYKNTFLSPACEQRGRKIRVDIPLARQLFDQRNNPQ